MYVLQPNRLWDSLPCKYVFVCMYVCMRTNEGECVCTYVCVFV